MGNSSEQMNQEPWGWESSISDSAAPASQQGYSKEQMQGAIRFEVQAEKQKHLATLYACVGFFFAGIILGLMAFYYARKAKAAGRKVGWAVYVLLISDLCIGTFNVYDFLTRVLPEMIS